MARIEAGGHLNYLYSLLLSPSGSHVLIDGLPDSGETSISEYDSIQCKNESKFQSPMPLATGSSLCRLSVGLERS